MKVLVACEESQEVCKAFRELGHEAYSCDILPCSGGHPEWHIHGDVLKLLETGKGYLQDGHIVYIKDWDLMIAHPPCTYLSYAGIRWFNIERYKEKAKERHKLKEEALNFVIKLYNSNIPRICIENPKGFLMKTIKQNQIVQPWMFGDQANKPTCLWLKNLPELKSTKIVDKGKMVYHIPKKANKPRADSEWYYNAIRIKDKAERSRFRSKTFPGIAKAMATQWSNLK